MEHIQLDRTEEEQVEVVKQWIAGHWLTITVAVVASIGIVYGLNYYKSAKIKKQNISAVKFNDLVKNIDSGKAELSIKTLDELKAKDSNSSYSSVGSLKLAKSFFEKKEYENAIKEYDWIFNNAKDSSMKSIAVLRKARALSELNKPSEAISELAKINDSSFTKEATLLKGDILLSENKFDEAVKVYESMIDDDKNSSLFEQRVAIAKLKKDKK